MNQYRIAQLEKNLERQYRLLAAAENGINQAQSTVAAEKYQIEIEDDIRPKIRVYEEEYFQNLQQLASTVTFRETEAQTVINIITQNVEQVKQQKTQYPNNLEELLKRIEEKLNGSSRVIMINYL